MSDTATQQTEETIPPVQETSYPAVTDEDRLAYFTSIVELLPYTKTVSLGNDTIQITFRTISNLERDLCLSTHNAISMPTQLGFTYVGYAALAMQVIKLKIDSKTIVFPKTLKEWLKHLETKLKKEVSELEAPRYITEEFRASINDSPELIEILTDQLILFNQHVNKLKEEIKAADFFKKIAGLKS